MFTASITTAVLFTLPCPWRYAEYIIPYPENKPRTTKALKRGKLGKYSGDTMLINNLDRRRTKIDPKNATGV